MTVKRLSQKKLKQLLLLTVLAVCITVYAIWGEAIASALEAYTGVSYNQFAKIFRELENGVQIHVIDVGQADSILIRSAEGNILIDAGTSSSESALSAYLDACRIKEIDCFICTHPHDDHIGGADMIIRRYQVKAVLMSELDVESSALDSLNECLDRYSVNTVIPRAGDEYTVGGITIKILAAPELSDNLNNSSLAVKLTYGDTSFLFTGDMEAEAELMLLAEHSPSELDCDFYKVAHHGANTSSCAELLAAVTPSISAISVGKDNEHGHPRGEVLARLEDIGCDIVLRTDTMGTCVVYSDGKELTVIS